MRRIVPRITPLLLAGALAGCSAIGSRFASHEDVFIPIPVQLGVARVTAGDTSWVLAERGYELVTADRALLAAAQPPLEQAAGRYRRYFGDDPPVVVVELLGAPAPGTRGDSARAALAAADSARRGGTRGAGAGVRGADGRRHVTVVMPARRPARRGEPAFAPPPSAGPVTRAWLSATADEVRPPASGPADSAAGATAATAGPMARPDDARLPDWIEAAAAELVAGSLRQDVLVAQLARQPDKLVPLRTFLSAPRPGAVRDSVRDDVREAGRPGAGVDPRAGAPAERRSGRGRSAPPLEGALLFDAQAIALTQFLLVKEGAPFVGEVVRTLAAGRPLEDALRGARELPKEVEGLESTFKAWLATQRDQGRR